MMGRETRERKKKWKCMAGVRTQDVSCCIMSRDLSISALASPLLSLPVRLCLGIL